MKSKLTNFFVIVDTKIPNRHKLTLSKTVILFVLFCFLKILLLYKAFNYFTFSAQKMQENPSKKSFVRACFDDICFMIQVTGTFTRKKIVNRSLLDKTCV